MITYEKYIKPFSEKFNLVEVTEEKIEKITELALAIIKAKNGEKHHANDNTSEFKRFYNGLLGEAALEQFFGIEGIIDWSVGKSNFYHTPDLRKVGLEVGVKTVTYGSFPIISKKSNSAEIIMISYKQKYVYICGLGTPDVLNKFQSTDLIKDRRLKERGTKTGFYGFEQLLTFNSFSELEKLLKVNINNVGFKM